MQQPGVAQPYSTLVTPVLSRAIAIAQESTLPMAMVVVASALTRSFSDRIARGGIALGRHPSSHPWTRRSDHWCELNFLTSLTLNCGVVPWDINPVVTMRAAGALRLLRMPRWD